MTNENNIGPILEPINKGFSSGTTNKNSSLQSSNKQTSSLVSDMTRSYDEIRCNVDNIIMEHDRKVIEILAGVDEEEK